MTFPISYYAAAGASAFVVSALSVPLWRRFCWKTGLVDDPGERKIHASPIPLAGGLAVLSGMAISLLAGAVFAWSGNASSADASAAQPHPVDLLSYGLHHRIVELSGIVLGAMGMLMLGLLDDRHELSPGPKFAGQVLIAFLVAAAGVRISLFVPNLVFQFAITILWVLTVINAFNFMDNMNGLCGGLGMIAALQFGLIAARAEQYLVASIAFVAAGALAGFLPYNFPRARVFLGDSGSHLVGYLLAVLAVLPHFYSSRTAHHSRWAVLAPVFVLAVPLADMVWVVALRSFKRQPFWIGDTNHLSHRLVRNGFTRPRAVMLIWALSAAIGAIAFVF